MPKQRRQFTREFKVEAVKLVTEKGYSVAEAARSLGLPDTLLRSWKKSFEAQPEQPFPGHGNRPPL
jgi:transposase